MEMCSEKHMEVYLKIDLLRLNCTGFNLSPKNECFGNDGTKERRIDCL